MEFHRGRLIDHIRLVAKDIEASRAFYEALLGVLGVAIEREGEGWFLADELLVAEGSRRGTGKIHLALQAKDEATVRAAFAAALETGGKSKAKPAKGDVHPFYYSATVLDPDGNAIEIVTHGPLKRSASSVVVKPSATALLRSLF